MTAFALKWGVQGTPAFIVFDSRTNKTTRVYRLQDLELLLKDYPL